METFIVLISIPLIIWVALLYQRKTTAKWVFIAAIGNLCVSLFLGIALVQEWNWEYLNLLSIFNALLNGLILLAIGRNTSSPHVKQ
ncbi:Uncharacterised protein [Corynebacterium kutscheri]|uniref:Uncharacterized protein n=1 Tax=Corynebacterium kutscheri TaxID=35755 RepID=A0A0F6R214_9CORY|nr:hypothetical protein UL82_10355 [Corynebacterium kutscheri]VEH05764.1 Uncharacterised protein [Corynebacterium kutscheri]VEH10548.1 Uncharacterised protein [Corynebacterium kutscheri]VEH81659.1 Uncharacterised protein [Corynebacterium kutscheri]